MIDLEAIRAMPEKAHASNDCGCGECVGYETAWRIAVEPLLAEVERLELEALRLSYPNAAVVGRTK